jgi:hypothetical protein
MNIDESILSKLTEEQQQKVKAAQSPEELLAVTKDIGYELSQDQLDAIAGGWNLCKIYYDPCRSNS